MLKVGITGGIGSGKSLVCQVLSYLGIPILDSDLLAKEIMISRPEVIQAIQATFGESAYFTNGRLNTSYLSDQIYNRPDRLKELNNIVHPVVRSATKEWFESQANHPYAVKEAALIFEVQANLSLDYVIGVIASRSVRIERVMHRSGLTKERIESIMENQPFAELLDEHADFIIRNDGKQLLIPQIVELHRDLVTISKNRMHSKGHHQEE